MTASRALAAAALAALLVLPLAGCRGTAAPVAPAGEPAEVLSGVDGDLDAIERELAGDAREGG